MKWILVKIIPLDGLRFSGLAWTLNFYQVNSQRPEYRPFANTF